MAFSVRSRRSDKTDDPFVVNEKEINEKYGQKGVAYKEEPAWLSKLYDQMRIAILTSLSLYLRVMKLGFPAYVTEVELETTRQINWYMASKFFIGKFPPLVGIICSGLTRIVGYYGTEELNYPGQPFIDLPMVALRRLSAILGASLIPLCYITLKNLGHSRSTATLAASLLIFENGLVTQSRYATPEIYVLFFSAFATCSWTLMHKHNQESQSIITFKSGFWQVMTGISLGCALSSKWTGALALPVIWISIGLELWNKICEKHNRIQNIMKQLFIYALIVGLLPISVYYSIFQFHLALVPQAGDHDILLSSRLKYSLIGNELEASQPNIAFGSQIVIKHDGSAGGYLHSHRKRFSGGSTQQEVTLYPHVDINNIWTVHKNNQLWNSSQPVQFVRNKDQIRLEHFSSSRKLHSHDHRPQLTNKKEHSEVTAYGDKLIEDSHDFWTLQILTDENKPSKDITLTWQPLTQRFRLIHIRGCGLISHNVHYAPPAGENHQEVTCMASAGTHISPWVVESSYHEQLENMTPITHAQMSKWEMTKELHKLMFNYPAVVYNRLQTGTTNLDGASHPHNSRDETPNKWFFKKSSLKIWNELAGYSTHLILNPIVQRLTIATMLTYLGFLALSAFLSKRQIKLPRYLTWLNFTGLDTVINEYYTRSIVYFYSAVIIQVGCLCFIPAYTVSMSDILNSVYYGVGLLSVFLEACTCRLPSYARRTVFYGVLALSVIKFSHLSHLAYGGKLWYRSECESSGLDIDCVRFPPHAADLADIIENSGSTLNSTQLTIYVELAGQSEPFRYNQGQEAEADKHIAMMKQASFMKEAQLAKGVNRYHRVLPTPAITPEEAARWAREVLDGAVQRVNEQHVQALRKAAEAVEEEKKKKNPENTINNKEDKPINP